MEKHTRYLGYRDGVFRVLVDGARPDYRSADRYNSAMAALTIALEYAQENYQLYARGVNKLCCPDGIAELASPEIQLREKVDDLILSVTSTSVFPTVSYIANSITPAG